jgi:pilin isopeptide linkage protein/LPXTG-motif cell wall-anchored protein
MVEKIAPAKAALAVSKSLTGRNLQADEFEFVLTDENGAEVERVKNTADGQVRFSEIEYAAAGVYNYTIKEVQGGTTVNNVTYDGLVVTATVTVTDNQQGQFVASVSYSGDTEFNNIYQETTTTTTTSTTTSTTTAATTTTSSPATTAAQGTTVETTSTTDPGIGQASGGQPLPPTGPKKGNVLPRTGAESGLVTSLIGFALLAATVLAGFFYRKFKKA